MKVSKVKSGIAKGLLARNFVLADSHTTWPEDAGGLGDGQTRTSWRHGAIGITVHHFDMDDSVSIVAPGPDGAPLTLVMRSKFWGANLKVVFDYLDSTGIKWFGEDKQPSLKARLPEA